ncbi:SRPBCC family protein [Nesterenkonia sp. F]|uniref:SRPBCC family protein n=1 Tax=Nesterenkonia sp. F TaxID=795955 RepID=UPI000255C90A|nr:SRPBCC family protein [Nesterenkonia sp. F]
MTTGPAHQAGAAADRMRRSRTLDAPPATIFAVLADPNEHQHTEPTDWVREAHDTAPLTDVGQVFGMRMFHVNAGGEYRMDNRVIAFEQDRVLAWEPGQYDDAGRLGTGGWTWRYDLAPVGGAGPGEDDAGDDTEPGTAVTLTYDWSGVPEPLRETFGLPPFGPEFLDDSLAALEARVTELGR